MFSCNLAATCTSGRMTWVFYVLLRQHEGGTDTEIKGCIRRGVGGCVGVGGRVVLGKREDGGCVEHVTYHGLRQQQGLLHDHELHGL